MNTIKLFESKNIRSVWNEAEEKWYFSVQDVVSILTETVDAKDYIKKIKKRDLQLNNNWGTICPLVEMVAGDGRKRKIQAADTKGLLRIIASTTAIVKTQNPKGFAENKKVAKQGGDVAGNARKELENKTGKSIIFSENFKQIEEKKQKKLK
jgi:hypothetical protein